MNGRSFEVSKWIVLFLHLLSLSPSPSLSFSSSFYVCIQTMEYGKMRLLSQFLFMVVKFCLFTKWCSATLSTVYFHLHVIWIERVWYIFRHWFCKWHLSTWIISMSIRWMIEVREPNQLICDRAWYIHFAFLHKFVLLYGICINIWNALISVPFLVRLVVFSFYPLTNKIYYFF